VTAESDVIRRAMEKVLRKEEQENCPNRSIPLCSLRELRRSRGLTQRDLGQLAKVSPGSVYRLENGLRGAYPATVRKLAAALEVPIEDLVRERRPEQGEIATPQRPDLPSDSPRAT
jgi:DNA-binding XRE family transcriptional regulator